jgi:hypothetical protein
LFDRGTVQALAGRFVRLLQTVTADPDLLVSQIEVADPEERDGILHGMKTGGSQIAPDEDEQRSVPRRRRLSWRSGRTSRGTNG